MKRRYLGVLILIAFTWAIFRYRIELLEIFRTFSTARLGWLLLAAGLQFVFYLLYATLYREVLAIFKVPMGIFSMLSSIFGSMAVNVVLPTLSIGGMAKIYSDLQKHKVSATTVITVMILVYVLDLLSFCLFLGLGLGYLFSTHQLQRFELVAAVILALLTLGLLLLLVLAAFFPRWLKTVLHSASRLTALLRPLNRQLYWPPQSVALVTAELEEVGNTMRNNPGPLLQGLFVAIAAQVVSVVSVWCIFLAYGHPTSLGIALAAFGIGMLFSVVSITPQGIGVVEGVMALVIRAIGFPSVAATAIAFTFRGLAFWIPLLVGIFTLEHVRGSLAYLAARVERLLVSILAYTTGIYGGITALYSLEPHRGRPGLLFRHIPLDTFRHYPSHFTAALAGIALIFLAFNLARRKRAAWVMTMLLLGLTLFNQLWHGFHYALLFLSLLLLIWLWLERHAFTTRSDPPSVYQGLTALAGAFLATLVYGTIGFYYLDHHFHQQFDLYHAILQTGRMFSVFAPDIYVHSTRFGAYFADSIYGIATVYLGYAFFMLLRPVVPLGGPTVVERQRARQIVERYGGSSLAHLLLLDDKQYYFYRHTVIGYALKNRVAVVLGDPVGPPEEVAAALQKFHSYCGENDWLLALYQTGPEYLPLYHQHGMKELRIGHEALIEVTSFSLESPTLKNVRNTYHRAQREGCSFAVWEPPLTTKQIDTIRDISEEWLIYMRGGEKQFSLGWFEDQYVRTSVVAVVFNEEKQAVAFATLHPEYNRPGLAVDLMRRRQYLVPGVMEYLFGSTLIWMQQKGYSYLNLGLSPLAGIGQHQEDSLAEKSLKLGFEYLNYFYRFKGLHGFKDKFKPQWSPRYLIYSHPTQLPSIWLAIIRANAGDAVLPKMARMLKRLR